MEWYTSLKQKAAYLRYEAFEMVIRTGKGHLGGSFSCVEMLVALYYGNVLQFDPKNPNWLERDRLILSKGHGINVFYVLLADVGFFSKQQLSTFYQNGSFLGGHTDAACPGIEITGGSLGHGLGVGAGMCLGIKMRNLSSQVYVILGDGECQEGSVWEAAMFAAHHNLNITVLLDRNRLASEGFTENILAIEPLKGKWESFGWQIEEVDGHNIANIIKLLKKTQENKPRIIICNTIKGKGIPRYENTVKSHHTLPNKEEVEFIRNKLLQDLKDSGECLV